MKKNNSIVILIALIVALGGLLMGFDASVISGVIKFIEPEFGLSKLELGWSVASLTLTSTLAMMIAGPLSDRMGRRTVLRYAAVLYAISAIGSAWAPDFISLVIARMIGGLGVGASLILAPMYIAEIAPAEMRGRLVSFNQLNIVIGISLAFFSNYLILQLGKSEAPWALKLKFDEYNWRWMLGIETIPAVMYFLGLFLVPRSPRWLILKGRFDEAQRVLSRFSSEKDASHEIEEIRKSITHKTSDASPGLKALFSKRMRLVMTIGIALAILQQITGINSVFFYAPMIFEQSGIGTDASFIQAILVGITNLLFTILAMLLIDRLGRKPLLLIGVSGMALSLGILAWGFHSSSYTLSSESISHMSAEVNKEALTPLANITYPDDLSFNKAIKEALGTQQANAQSAEIISAAISTNPALILAGILGFVASFAISIGPVMWVLFSELFPNAIRGVAISFVGLINSAVSFVVQWVFPAELEFLGNAWTFGIYAFFAAIGVIFIVIKVPETKGKSLEELEEKLVGHAS